MSEAIRTVATGNFTDAIFSSDGSRLYAVSGNTVSVIDVASGTVLSQYTVGQALGGISVSPDGTHLSVVERHQIGDGPAVLFEINLATGVITTHSLAGTSGPFYDVAYLANGTALVSVQSSSIGTTTMQILDFWSGQFTTINASGDAAAAMLTASADYSHVLVEPLSGRGTYVYVSGVGFVAQSQHPPNDIYGGAALPGATFGIQATSPDGTLYVQGLKVFDASLNVVASLGPNDSVLNYARGVTFSADGQQLFLTVGSSVLVFSTSTWEVHGAYDAGGIIPAPNVLSELYVGYGDMVQASPTGQYLSVITSDGIKLIDLTTAVFEVTNGSDTIVGEGLLIGLGGNDDLSGIGTYATMAGGTGDDTYHITGYSDTAYELSNQGHDTVHSVVGYTLSANIEDMVLDGYASIGGFGNDLANWIVGNSAANELGGAAGNDQLQGLAGDDKLDGGAGADVMDGGAGVNTATYISALSGVTVNLGVAGQQDTGGAGSDTLISIENLFGSWQDDRLTGNAGANRIEGFVGDDVLRGGLGADTLVGGDGADTFIGTAAEFNGDTIDDFTTADKIVITDANFDTFTCSLSGNVLTYTGGSLTLGSVPTDDILVFRNPDGGVQLQIGPVVGTLDQIADQLTSGFWDGDAHRWNVAPGGTITVNIASLTAAEKILARAALSEWKDIIRVNFQEVVSGGQIVFNHNEEPGGPVAYTDSNWTNGFLTSATIHISTSWVTQSGSGLGTYSFQTYLHEIGHALGLGHPGTYNETANYPGDAIFWNDSWATSVMSYFDQQESFYHNGYLSFAYAVTPMLADIAAMQQLYGLSTTTRLSDTVYGYNSTAGGVYNATAYPNVAFTIFDNGGTDTLDYSGYGGPQLLDLNPEAYSNVGGQSGTVAIARGVIIENAIGGGGNDTIIGNSANNVLTGNLGADILTGGAGSDSFRDSSAGHNGDIITDLGLVDKIIFTDATLASFTYSMSGGTLTYSGGSMTLGGFDGVLVASAAAGGGVQLIMQPRDVANDFNGDGRSDILWRNDNGTLTNWLGQTNGVVTSNSANFVAGIGSDWTIAGTGDFNGDVKDDILWRNGSGIVSDWLGQANGGFVSNSGNFVAGVAAEWAIAGIGDFNGDLKDDILWRNANGTLTDWLGQANGGFTPNNGNFVSGIANDWTIAAIGDFNGDLKDDILWRNVNGTLTDWLGAANGSFTPNNGNFVAGVEAEWTIVGSGDFNGDGKDDILWRNANGTLTDWLGDANGGFTLNNANFVSGVGAEWTVAQIGDFNGDGKDDILWRNNNGTLTNWLGAVNGMFTPNNGVFVAGVGNDWHIQPPDLV